MLQPTAPARAVNSTFDAPSELEAIQQLATRFPWLFPRQAPRNQTMTQWHCHIAGDVSTLLAAALQANGRQINKEAAR